MNHFEVEDFESILRQYKGMGYKTVYLIPGNAQGAEDVLEEVFIKVHKSLGTFDSRKGAF